MLEQCDPMQEVDPEAWSALSESERLQLVMNYHEREGIHLPNAALHATLHCVIENQAALGEETPVLSTLQRLVLSGLTRHEAVHAVASVLGKYFYQAWKARRPADETSYFAELESLSADRWRPSL